MSWSRARGSHENAVGQSGGLRWADEPVGVSGRPLRFARVCQSGSGPARHGRLSKEDSAAGRHVLVEAAWTASRSPGPLHGFAARVAARRGCQVATGAVARKLCVLCWCLLSRGGDHAFARPSLLCRKLRRLELAAGAPGRKSGAQPSPVWNRDADEREQRRQNKASAPTNASSSTGRQAERE
jgi:hypothetical protein